jgi:exonuclease III
MANFGFWNVDARRDLLADDRELPRWVAELAVERSLDVLVLIECAIPAEAFATAFAGPTSYYPVSCGERFKVLVRFDPELMQRLPLPVSSNRFDIWHLTLPLQVDVILSVVHGLDKRNYSESRQGLFLQQVTSALEYVESQIGHTRSIVLGDFNANPFESPVAGALGMNAVMSRAIARSDPRRLEGRNYPYFYNPMWNVYGDERRGSAPATYYYRGSDTLELCWHMLDQVLIRPALLSRFESSSIEIVTTVCGTELTGTSGIPDRTRFSDHLPVVFALDLTERGDEGANDVREPLAGF